MGSRNIYVFLKLPLPHPILFWCYAWTANQTSWRALQFFSSDLARGVTSHITARGQSCSCVGDDLYGYHSSSCQRMILGIFGRCWHWTNHDVWISTALTRAGSSIPANEGWLISWTLSPAMLRVPIVLSRSWESTFKMIKTALLLPCPLYPRN